MLSTKRSATSASDTEQDLLARGRELMSLRRWAEACELFDIALASNPDSLASVYRGWCCSYLGRLGEAIAACRLDRMLPAGEFRPPAPALHNALEWVDNHVAPGGGIRVHSGLMSGYPEVTGYFIPTLLEYGKTGLATSFAEWLVSIQSSDGSFAGPEDRAYVFDTAQVLRGLLAIHDRIPVIDAIRIAADYIVSQQDRDAPGRFLTQYDGSDPEIRESILLYALGPLKQAGKLLDEPRYVAVADSAFEFYTGQSYALDDSTLTHYLAYEVEAVIDWGRPDLAVNVLGAAEARLKNDGALPGKPSAEWVCIPGSAQFALCWYKVGRHELADRVLAWLEGCQRASGGWPGSIGPGACYAQDVEPSWAIKYYLDAHRQRVTSFMARYADKVAPPDVAVHDDRLAAIAGTIQPGDRVVEVGCGRGRWLRLIRKLAPDVALVGIDPTPELLQALADDIEGAIGSFEHIPAEDDSFDVVFTVEAIAQASDLERSVLELVRVAKPGGSIIIIDKNDDHFGRLVCPPWEQWVNSKRLSALLADLCSDVSAVPVSYAGRTADGLMMAWRGTKSAHAALPRRERVVSISLPAQFALAQSSATGTWLLPRLSENISIYTVTVAADRIPPNRTLKVGNFSVSSGNAAVTSVSLFVPGPVLAQVDRIEMPGLSNCRLTVLPLLVNPAAPGNLLDYEAVMAMPVARQLLAAGLLDDGLQVLEVICACNANLAEARYLLGYALTLMGGDLDRALAHYREALELGFSEFWVRYNRGSLYLNNGLAREATADLSRAAEIDPQHEGVRVLLQSAVEKGSGQPAEVLLQELSRDGSAARPISLV